MMALSVIVHTKKLTLYYLITAFDKLNFVSLHLSMLQISIGHISSYYYAERNYPEKTRWNHGQVQTHSFSTIWFSFLFFFFSFFFSSTQMQSTREWLMGVCIFHKRIFREVDVCFFVLLYLLLFVFVCLLSADVDWKHSFNCLHWNVAS